MKKRTIILLALIGLTVVLEACNLLSHGKEGVSQKQPPKNVNQTLVNPDSLPSMEQSGQTTEIQTENYIGETRALEIALEHAKVSSGNLLFSKSHLDRDDGRVVYDVEFYAVNKEYDYEIDAVSGNILGFDTDMEYEFIPPAFQNNSDTSKTPVSQEKQQEEKPQPKAELQPLQEQSVQQQPINEQAPSNQPSGTVGATSLEAAKQIALSKVPGATADHIRIKEDYDDGRLTYEGKIIYNQMEYEFEIDAASGNITDWDQESIYD